MTEFLSNNLLFCSVIFAVLLVILIITLRWFSYKERMAIIARGLPLERKRSKEERQKFCLAVGITISLIGFALTAGLATIGIGPWLLAGLLPLFIGLSMILASLVLRPSESVETQEDAQQEVAVTDDNALEERQNKEEKEFF